MNLIIFDIDGTLTRTFELDTRCLADAACRVLGVAEIDEDWSHYAEATDSGIVRELLERHLPAAVAGHGLKLGDESLISARMANEIEAAFLANLEVAVRVPGACEATPGALSLLAEIRQRDDFAFALATGCWRDSALLKLAAAGIDCAGAVLSTASEHVARESIVRAAIEASAPLCGVEAFKSVTYVGDGVWDLQAAKRAGIGFVGIGNGKRATALRDAGAVQVIEDFSDCAAVWSAVDAVRQ